MTKIFKTVEEAGKLLVIGEAARGGKAPLDGPGGLRLARFLGLSLGEFLVAVEVRNLLSAWPGRQARGKGHLFDRRAARVAASSLELTNRVVLLLGQRVAAAFGLTGLRPPCAVVIGYGEAAAFAVPHPSGIVRWYNDPANVEEAARTVRRAARLAGMQLSRRRKGLCRRSTKNKNS